MLEYCESKFAADGFFTGAFRPHAPQVPYKLPRKLPRMWPCKLKSRLAHECHSGKAEYMDGG